MMSHIHRRSGCFNINKKYIVASSYNEDMDMVVSGPVTPTMDYFLLILLLQLGVYVPSTYSVKNA